MIQDVASASGSCEFNSTLPSSSFVMLGFCCCFRNRKCIYWLLIGDINKENLRLSELGVGWVFASYFATQDLRSSVNCYFRPSIQKKPWTSPWPKWIEIKDSEPWSSWRHTPWEDSIKTAIVHRESYQWCCAVIIQNASADLQNSTTVGSPELASGETERFWEL